MKKLFAMCLLVATPAFADVTGSVSVVSDYKLRGISQTHGGAAVQGGIEAAFDNGMYVGVWGSTISWVKDAMGQGRAEADLYVGRRGQLTADIAYDAGVITYIYPNHGHAVPGVISSPNTTEAYLQLATGPVAVKYSHVISRNFVGWYGGANYNQDTRGSGYLEANATFDLGSGLAITGHVGHQRVRGSVATAIMDDASYTDWKLGVTKDIVVGVVGIAYTGTDVSGTCTASGGTSAYCWGINGSDYKNVAADRVVVSFTKTF